MKLLPDLGRRFRRNLLVISVLLWSTTAFLVIGPRAKHNVMPGPLSSPHAALERDCGNCHVDGTGLVKGLDSGFSHSEISLLEGHRCLDCHDRGTYAFQPHSIERARLEEATVRREAASFEPHGSMSKVAAALGLPASDRGEIACAVCHREHRGRLEDIAAQTDALCQTCHVDGDDAFPGAHPSFDAWPYDRRTKIIFDHANHLSRHFPAEKSVFDCSSCHEVGGGQPGFMQTLPFEKACVSCHHHDEQILGTAKSEAGIALISAFGLDLEVFEDPAEGVDCWPADGADHDHPPTALNWLLVLGDVAYPEASRDRLLLAGVDLSDLMDADDETKEAALRFAQATKRLIVALGSDPHGTLMARLSAVSPPATEDFVSDFAGAWSDVALGRLAVAWFAGGAPETGALSAGAGRYELDPHDPILRYTPSGHGDKLLSGLHRWAYASGDAELITALESDGRCTKCHAVEGEGSSGQIQFRARTQPAATAFLSFDHRPHLVAARRRGLSPEGSTCQVCHEIAESKGYLAAFEQHDPGQFEAGFAVMSKDSCARCHDQRSTASRCVDCHQYHAR